MRRLDETLAHQWFGTGWLQIADAVYERRLDLTGKPVPNTRPDPSAVLDEIERSGDVHDFDPATELPLGAHVRHPEYGEGVVVHVELVRFGIRYPDVGGVNTPRTPPGARAFDPAHRYAQGDVFVHPKHGPGVVLIAHERRICVRFAVGEAIYIANGE